MKFKRTTAPKELKPYVESFWTLESEKEQSDEPNEFKEFSFFANPFPQVVFQYEGHGFMEIVSNGKPIPIPSSHFYGQSPKPINIATAGAFKIVGVNFFPYAIPMLFGIRSHTTTGKVLELTSLFGESSGALESHVVNAGTNQERMGILEKEITKLIDRHDERDPIIEASIQFFLSTKGRESVESLCKHLGYSVRQVERNFKDKIGISPKLYARMLRFHFAMQNFRVNDYHSLRHLAFDSGYADQSHFIRDFKQFSSLNPHRYFRHLNADISLVEYKKCQSCGMPMQKDPKKGGTNKDGSLNHMYCSYCYQAGEFIHTDWTAEHMMDFVKSKMKEMGFPGFIAGFFTRGIPKLERWTKPG